MSKTGRPKTKRHFTRTRKGLMRLLFGVDCNGDVALMPNRRRRECVPIRDKRSFRWVLILFAMGPSSSRGKFLKENTGKSDDRKKRIVKLLFSHQQSRENIDLTSAVSRLMENISSIILMTS